MNDRELNERLKSAAAPEPTESYWNEFPKKVTATLHWQSQSRSTEAPRFAKRFLATLGLGLATLCVLIGFAFGFWRGHELRAGEQELADARKCYREVAAMFPNQVRAIVFDGQGAHLVLSEKADVPESTPLYVRVCGPAGCNGFVTFSGQQIQVNGERCEVLSDARGGVILVGKNTAWSSDSPPQAKQTLRIHAEPLGTAL